MKTKFKDVWYIEAGVVAIICLIAGASGWIFGFDAWLLPVLLVPLSLYALAVRVFGHGSSLEMGQMGIIAAIFMAIWLPVFRQATLNRRLHEQRMALQKRATMRGHLVTPKALRHEESGVKPQPTK